MPRAARFRTLLARAALFAGLSFPLSAADIKSCACDPAVPATLEARECSLCLEAGKQKSDVEVFFLKDINPRKPNRWLALPRIHAPGPHSFSALAPALRTALWTAAIEKARSLWGADWGLAVNGVETRTQCHTHIHIGKVLEESETSRGGAPDTLKIVNGPAEIPVQADEAGFWIHEANGRLHIHSDGIISETALQR
jgi:CDP-diacylglycerol pyrophosphatase